MPGLPLRQPVLQCSHGYPKHNPAHSNPTLGRCTRTSHILSTCLIDIHQALHCLLEQAAAWTQTMDSSVRNGPLSCASPLGKAKKWQTVWGHAHGAWSFAGQDTCGTQAHMCTHAVNHLSEKRRMSGMDRRCLEPGSK